jgi:hypothetical protein
MATATVRVRCATDTAGERPDQAKMERAAALLQESGFKVLRIGRFGVNIQGDEQAFQRALGVDISNAKGLVKAPRPPHQELSQLIDLVEITGPPLNFA